MKKLLLLLFSLLLSFNSYGDWTKTSEDTDGDSFYIDFQTIKKLDNGNVIFWGMVDNLEGNDGFMSSTEDLSSLTIKKNNFDKILNSKKMVTGIIGGIILICLMLLII